MLLSRELTKIGKQIIQPANIWNNMDIYDEYGRKVKLNSHVGRVRPQSELPRVRPVDGRTRGPQKVGEFFQNQDLGGGGKVFKS